MTTFTLNTFSINSHATKMEFDPSNWSDEFVQCMIEQGIKVRVDRSSASLTIKEGFGDIDRLEKAQKTAKDLQDGKIPSGGGSSRHTLEELGFLAALEQVGFKPLRIETGELTKTGAKATKAEPVLNCLGRYVQQEAKKHNLEVTDEVVKFISDKLRSFDSFKIAAGIKKDDMDMSGLEAFGKKTPEETEETEK